MLIPMPRALLIAGPPNSRKTTSLLTWTKAARPGRVHIVSCPRERGFETIPTNDPNIVPHILTVPYTLSTDPAKANPLSWRPIVESVEIRCAEILAGKHGPAGTIAIDGLQKYAEACLAWMSSGRCFTDEAFNGMQVYPKAQGYVVEFMLKLMSASVDYVDFTTWADYEKDRESDPDPKTMNEPKPPRHQWPDLMGKLAKRVVGMASTVFAVCNNNVYQWQTKAAGDILGCGLKGTPDIIAKVPLFVPQDWPTLEKLLYPAGYP